MTSSDRPRLSVLGTGYLGATHAVCMTELGYEVTGRSSPIFDLQPRNSP